jgi:phenylpropionate dioxygenase-like ring-hydroxylating dioxygenase large terminal subunit
MNDAPLTPRPIRGDVEALRQMLAEWAAHPQDAPRSLPGVFYSDLAYFQHECDTVLQQGWHCVGRADEIPNPGDYLTVQVLQEPIIIVRDGTEVRALSNLCRHRGMPIAEGQGNAKRLVCRYHAWTYGTDGALLRAPRMVNAGFDPKTCKLGSFHCRLRFGFIYVSLAETPPDIDQDLQGLGDLINPYQPDDYRVVHAASEVWHCNWKSLVENFMECYHLSVVHPQTLHGYTPTGLSRKGPNGTGFTSYFANYPDNIPSRGEGAPGLSAEQKHRSTLFAVYPCQVVSVAASLLVSLSILPLTPTSIAVRWTMSVHGDSLDGDTIDQRIALWEDVNREDREKLEAMQSALRSRHATGGPLAGADYEGTVRDFLVWLAAEDARAS